MEMPKLFSEAKVAPQWKVNAEDIKKMGLNILIFTSPVLALFFAQLALGVDPKAAALVALLALYQVLADFFKKMSDGKK